MLNEKGQAEDYARDMTADEGWPPFVIVCDVVAICAIGIGAIGARTAEISGSGRCR